MSLLDKMVLFYLCTIKDQKMSLILFFIVIMPDQESRDLGRCKLSYISLKVKSNK